MNKPVVVSEEALVAPVIVPDVTPRSRRRKAAARGAGLYRAGGISFSHFLNDTMQSLIASVYPILKDSYALDFAQIGMITLAFQFTASLLQPVIGHFTDKKAQPFSLAIGMGFTFFGLLLLSVAQRYPVILVAAALVGLGSAVFHPESARIARLASGGRYGFAQSVFQLGGSFGTSMGPLLAALIVVPFGQPSIAWFSSIAFLAIVILWRIGHWYRPQIATKKAAPIHLHPDAPSSRRVMIALGGAGRAVVLQAALRVEPVELLHLLPDRQVRRLDPGRPVLSLHLPCRERGGGVLRRAARRSLRPQIRDLVFDPRRAAVHAGAALCRPVRERGADGVHRPHHFVGDVVDHRVRAGTDAAPLRHDLRACSSEFAFGIGGLGAAVLGKVADHTGIAFVYQVCAFLPAIGLLAVFLPKLPKAAR